MKLSINLDEAKNLHQDYYNSDFIVTSFTRSGQFDFPPYSFVYGISDAGSWEGNISTDGENFVVTRSGYISADKVKNVYKFSRDDIKNVKTGIFKTTFRMKKHIPGLTKRGVIGGILLLFLVGLFFPRRIFQIRVSNEYKTEKDFEEILKNPEAKVSKEETQSAKSPSDDTKQVDQESQANGESNSSGSDTPEERLLKLNELKDKGVINEEEFSSKKEEILKDF